MFCMNIMYKLINNYIFCQVKFSADGTKLFTGARKDNKLLGWDTRQLRSPLFTLHREVATNQRIEFDLTPDQQLIISGMVKFWV